MQINEQISLLPFEFKSVRNILTFILILMAIVAINFYPDQYPKNEFPETTFDKRILIEESKNDAYFLQLNESSKYISYLYYSQFLVDNWSSTTPLPNFENSKGKFFIRFIFDNKFSIKNKRTTFFVLLYFLDGYYTDNYHSEIAFVLLKNSDYIDGNSMKLVFEFLDLQEIKLNYPTIISSPNLGNLKLNTSTIEVIFNESILSNNQPEINDGGLIFKGLIESNRYKISLNGQNKNIKFREKLWNFAYIISFMSLFQAYFSYKLFLRINVNLIDAQYINLITFSFIVIFDLCSCVMYFYIFLSRDLYWQFMFPSIIYSLIFIVFDQKILFYTWFSGNLPSNLIEAKKKFMCYIFFIYFMVFFIIFNSSNLIKSPFIIIGIYLFVWIPQILHNYQKRVTIFSFGYVFTTTINMIFIPIYFKGCSYNFLLLKPDYLFVIILTFLMLISVFILHAQKKFGVNSFIPVIFRKIEFNYYIESNEISDTNKDIECIICLDVLYKINLYDINDIQKNYFLKRIYKNMKSFLVRMFNPNNRTPHMKTPCNHYFHSECLEAWMSNKLFCPFCRSALPVLG